MSSQVSKYSLSRRCFLYGAAATATISKLDSARGALGTPSQFVTRGAVLCRSNLSLPDWPQRAAAAGLTTVALHSSPSQLERLTSSDKGRQFLEQCSEAGLQVEYEMHAMQELLPRTMFDQSPDLFRMNEEGRRTADANCCVHSAEALGIICENAVRLTNALRPTTDRYYYWGDDGASWCHCPKCKELTGSDQALVVENEIVRALRERNPLAQLAHLAYTTTIEPPRQVRPEEGVFLEFAPFRRKYAQRYESPENDKSKDPIRLLDANLEVFPVETAQVLEYWLDSSLFSRHRRPAKKIPWDAELFAADVAAYGRRGIRHFTSFACFVDAEYLQLYGEPPLNEYGRMLNEYRG